MKQQEKSSIKRIRKPGFFLLGLFILTLSCKKDNTVLPGKSTATELLTREKWILSGYGFDDNHNNKLDPQENIIGDCQKDNSYRFEISGNGSFLDNAISCGGPAETVFNWRLSNNETRLEIEFELSDILVLNETSLVISPELVSGFIMSYGH